MINPNSARQVVSRSFIVDSESAGQRVDVFLSASLVDISRSLLQRWIEEHHIVVEGRSVRASYRVRAGDKIVVNQPPPEPPEPLAQDIPVAVLFEDQDIIVVNKPAGLVVHPAPGNPDGTLVNALLHHCPDLTGIAGTIRPGIVHRLDRGTSGVMVVTKNDQAHKNLAQQFLKHTTGKIYLAFVGQRSDARELSNQGVIETLFGRHPIHRKRFSSRVERGKSARTEFAVKTRYTGDGWSALQIEARPITGRTHQIRVHLADMGYPILGDSLYGGRSTRVFPDRILPSRPALHAKQISFLHPVTGRKVVFQAPLPDDLLNLQQLLEKEALQVQE